VKVAEKAMGLAGKAPGFLEYGFVDFLGSQVAEALTWLFICGE